MGHQDHEALCGKWVHSHEEDTDDKTVFRPATHDLPPSRGRLSLDLRPDGTYVENAPGPVDLPEETTGSWTLEGGRLVLRSESGEPTRSWEVATLDSNRLAMKRL